MYTFRINLRTHVEEPLADHGIQEHSVCAWSGGRSVELTSKERIQQRTIEDMEGVFHCADAGTDYRGGQLGCPGAGLWKHRGTE